MDYGSLQTIASKLGLLTVKEEGTKPKLYVWPQTKMVRDSVCILHRFRFKFLLLEITSLHYLSLISHTVFYYLKHFWNYTLLEHSSSVLLCGLKRSEEDKIQAENGKQANIKCTLWWFYKQRKSNQLDFLCDPTLPDELTMILIDELGSVSAKESLT